MEKTFKLSAILLTLIMAFTLTACEKEPENPENTDSWSLPGVVEEIKFNGEKVMFPMSLDDFGKGYTRGKETLSIYEKTNSNMKTVRMNYDNKFFGLIGILSDGEIDDTTPIKLIMLKAEDNPDISINGVTFSSTYDDVIEIMGEPTAVRGADEEAGKYSLYYTTEEPSKVEKREIDQVSFIIDDFKIKEINIMPYVEP